MFGLISLFTSFLFLSWRYISAALLGGMTLLALFIGDQILIKESAIAADVFARNLFVPILYNAFILALCAIPFSFSFILIGRITGIKSWIYYAIVGGLSGYGALWVLTEYLNKTHISLDLNSPELIATVIGGILTGIFYRLIGKC